MSNQISDPSDLHPSDQLPLLLSGELTLDELRTVVLHTRACPLCQAELVEVAAGFGALRGVALAGLTDIEDPPPLAVHPIEASPIRPVDDTGVAEAGARQGSDGSGASPSTARRRSRLLTVVGAAAAAVVLVLGGVLVGSRLGGADEDLLTGPTTQVALEPVGPTPATGTVTMAEVEGTDGAEQLMSVDTSLLPPAPDDAFYEVWLLQPETGQMLAVGVLPSDAASFTLPAALVANYQAVDVSLQPDDGGVVHSGDSVLRATYA